MAIKTHLVLYAGDDWAKKQPNVRTFQHSYEVFRDVLTKKDMQLARSSIKWYRAGTFSRYWLLDQDGTWQKVKKPLKPLVVEDRTRTYDSTGSSNALYDHARVDISQHIQMFNSPEFTLLVDNKLNQAVIFKDYMPATTLWLPGDVVQNRGSNPIVLKNLGGSGGQFVKILKTRRQRVDSIQIQQEFVQASKRGTLKDSRIVFVGDKPIYGLQRTAGKGSYHTNIHHGGTSQLVSLKSLGSLVAHATKIAAVFDMFPKKLFSLDFMVDTKSNKPYLIECNSQPGIDTLNNDPTIAHSYFTALSKHILS